MSDYTKTTNFTSKDSLSVGNPLKIVRGSEIDTEFNNIATSVATKLNSADFSSRFDTALDVSFPNLTGSVTATDSQLNVAAGPIFSAYMSSGVLVPNNTATKLLFQTEEFDVGSAFDVALGRFKPLTAGYYQVNAQYCFNGVAANSTSVIRIALYKNGASLSTRDFLSSANVAQSVAIAEPAVFLNGSSDYIEVYALQNSGVAQTVLASQTYTRFSGLMVRA